MSEKLYFKNLALTDSWFMEAFNFANKFFADDIIPSDEDVRELIYSTYLDNSSITHEEFCDLFNDFVSRYYQGNISC